MKSDPIIEKLKGRLQYDKDLFDKSIFLLIEYFLAQNLNKYLELDKYTFTNYPFYLWIAGLIIFIVGLCSSYLIFIDQEHQHRTYTKILLNILAYYLSFYIIYVGKVEVVEINRKVKYLNSTIIMILILYNHRKGFLYIEKSIFFFRKKKESKVLRTSSI